MKTKDLKDYSQFHCNEVTTSTIRGLSIYLKKDKNNMNSIDKKEISRLRKLMLNRKIEMLDGKFYLDIVYEECRCDWSDLFIQDVLIGQCYKKMDKIVRKYATYTQTCCE